VKWALLLVALAATPALAQENGHAGHAMDHAQPASGEQAIAPEAEAAPQEVVGTEPPPPAPSDHAADLFYPTDRMAHARDLLLQEGRFTTFTLFADRLEYRSAAGKDGYAWSGEFWYGGDLDRLAIASEGEGEIHRSPERAEVRAMWRHAIDPWFNLEMGMRHDFRPDPERSYAAIGIEGLAPYWFDVEGQLFLSDKGDVHVRAEADYDQRITQRLILQPRVELNAAFQQVPALGIGAGLDRLELGARLRYEIAPEFAPYVGLHWERKLGDSARFARLAGESHSSLARVFGIRTGF
jgi:copper resistance protein B